MSPHEYENEVGYEKTCASVSLGLAHCAILRHYSSFKLHHLLLVSEEVMMAGRLQAVVFFGRRIGPSRCMWPLALSVCNSGEQEIFLYLFPNVI